MNNFCQKMLFKINFSQKKIETKMVINYEQKNPRKTLVKFVFEKIFQIKTLDFIRKISSPNFFLVRNIFVQTIFVVQKEIIKKNLVQRKFSPQNCWLDYLGYFS